jgi:hypothetical protein
MTDFRPNPDDPSAPRGRDPTLEPMPRDRVGRDGTGGAMWGWIAGIAVLILIGFIVVGGWGSGNRNGTDTASNRPAPATTGSAPSNTGTAPSTTGAAPASR